MGCGYWIGEWVQAVGDCREARAWAIRLKRERDELQARLDAMIQERDDARFAPNMALVRVQELEAELEALRHACSTEQQRLKATADMVADLRCRCGRLQAELKETKASRTMRLGIPRDSGRDGRRGHETRT